MGKRRSHPTLLLAMCLSVCLGFAHQAWAAEVFLSNNLEGSEATYVIQFVTGVAGPIKNIEIAFPPGTVNPGTALGALAIDGSTIANTMIAPDPVTNTVTVTRPSSPTVGTGMKIRVELFNLTNPPLPGGSIIVRTLNSIGGTIETLPPIGLFIVVSGDITAVNTPPGSGLTGGAVTGDATLSVDTTQIQKRVIGSCALGSAIREIDANGLVTCEVDDNSGGTITGVTAGAGLTGGGTAGIVTLSVATGAITSAMIQDGTVGSADVNATQVQLRVGGTCLEGQAIRIVNQDGSVTCQPSGGLGGGGTVDMVPKFTAATTLGDSVISEVGGNVGIGTTSPDNRRLHVVGVQDVTAVTIEGRDTNTAVPVGNTMLRQKSTGTITDGYGPLLSFTIQGAGMANDEGVAAIAGLRDGANNSGALALYSLNAGVRNERFRITKDGNVGIGTPAPARKLQVHSDQGVLALFTGPEGTNRIVVGSAEATAKGLAVGYANNGDFGWISVLGDGAGASLVIDNGGNVGIGKTAPTTLLDVNGTITAVSKNFQIAHPVEPDRKVLIHSALEGPEVGVYYRGKAQLVDGEVVVTLPPYFEALTRREQRTVQLTPIGGFAPLYVVDDVREGRFTVRTEGGNQALRFYWEVKAVRADIPALVVEKLKGNE